MGKKNRYIKFTENMLRVLRGAKIPKYFSKFSNKLYDNHQHATLLALKQYENNKGYRRIVEWVEVSTEIREVIGLEKVPHFTALQKFAARIATSKLERIILAFVAFTKLKKLELGGDATGFQPTHASSYYTRVVERKSKKKHRGRPRKKRKVKKYVKQTAVVELRTQLICTTKIRRGPANDNKDVVPSLKKVKRQKKPVKSCVWDKGGDAEKNHRFIREELNAESVIPARNQDVPVHRTKGRYRKKMKRHLPKKKLNKRVKCETVNSVQKRLMSSHLKSRHWYMQNKELLFRDIAYNAHRLSIIFWFWRGFLQSRFDLSLAKILYSRFILCSV